MVENLDLVVNKIEKLKKIEESVTIDEFSTDCTSLSSLNQLSFDQININEWFVSNTDIDNSDAVKLKSKN